MRRSLEFAIPTNCPPTMMRILFHMLQPLLWRFSGGLPPRQSVYNLSICMPPGLICYTLQAYLTTLIRMTSITDTSSLEDPSYWLIHGRLSRAF
jgi:hypothetical protein